MADSPYDVLKVKTDDGIVAIKKAYRRLVMGCHPDSPTPDVDKFRKIQEAYELLSDKDKRKKYDAIQDALKKTQNPTRPTVSPWQPTSSSFGFGMTGGSSFNARYGQPVHYQNQSTITLSFSVIYGGPQHMALIGLGVGNVVSIDSSGMIGGGGVSIGTISRMNISMNMPMSGGVYMAVDMEIAVNGTFNLQQVDAIRSIGKQYNRASVSTTTSAPYYNTGNW